jgi:hypothetical protein
MPNQIRLRKAIGFTYTQTNVMTTGMRAMIVVPGVVTACEDSDVEVTDSCLTKYSFPTAYVSPLPHPCPTIRNKKQKIEQTQKLINGQAAIVIIPGIISRAQQDIIQLEDRCGDSYSVSPIYIQLLPSDFPQILRSPEHVTADYSRSLTCVCGNIPESGGFTACDRQGNQIEPGRYNGWASLYICDDCGRIINENRLEVIGFNPQARYEGNSPEEYYVYRMKPKLESIKKNSC